MAATDTDSVHDHMTRLRMKMVQQVSDLTWVDTLILWKNRRYNVIYGLHSQKVLNSTRLPDLLVCDVNHRQTIIVPESTLRSCFLRVIIWLLYYNLRNLKESVYSWSKCVIKYIDLRRSHREWLKQTSKVLCLARKYLINELPRNIILDFVYTFSIFPNLVDKIVVVYRLWRTVTNAFECPTHNGFFLVETSVERVISFLPDLNINSLLISSFIKKLKQYFVYGSEMPKEHKE